MKALTMMLLTMFSSCNVVTVRPYIEPQERCAYSSQFNKCRCIEYDIYNVKTIGEGYDMPAEYCDDIVGFKAEAWLKAITPWGRENIRTYEDARD